MFRFTVNTNSSTSVGCLCFSCMIDRATPHVVEHESDEDNIYGLKDDAFT